MSRVLHPWCVCGWRVPGTLRWPLQQEGRARGCWMAAETPWCAMGCRCCCWEARAPPTTVPALPSSRARRSMAAVVGVTALGCLLPALILLLSRAEGFIPFLCFIWKETLSLWLLLLLVVGVFAEIRPLSPCPPPGAAGSLPPLSGPPAAVRAGSAYANGPGLSWLVCNDLWLHLYANTNNLLLS